MKNITHLNMFLFSVGKSIWCFIKIKKTWKSFEDGRAEEGNRRGRAREIEKMSVFH